MNLNHDPDKHIIDQIDKLLETNQPTGDALLDDLATTRPIANPTFQTALEERLVARFEQHKQGEILMMTSTSYIPMPAPRRNWLPLTLLAALLVVAIAGIMLINGIGKSPTPNEIALAQPTVTPTTAFPTEVPTETVVQNTRVSSDSPGERVAIGIPLSSLTSDSLVPGVGGSVDIVALLPSKPANLNINTVASTLMPDGSRLIETVLIRDTFVLYHGAWPQAKPTDQSSTITFAVTPQDSRMLAWLAEQPQVTFRLQQPLNNVFDLPADSKMIDIPFDNVTAEENIHPGDKVDIFSTCALVPDVTGINNTVISSKTDCTQSEEVKRASNAIVFIGEIVVTGRQPVITYQGISLSVAPETVPLFTQLLDAKMHFKLVKSTTSNQPTPVPLPTGKVSVDNLPTNIPSEIALAQPTVTTNAEKTTMVIPRIHFVEVNNAVQEGHPANILFSFFYLSKMDNSPDSLIKPESEILPVAENIDVIKVVQDNITVSVTHEQSILIQWALDSKLALILNTKMPPITPTSPITGDAIVNVPPSGNRIVDIPLLSIKSGKDIERGTSVNIVAICAYIPETTGTDHLTELAKTDCAQPKETTVVSNGLVVLPVLKPNDGSYPVFSIAVDASEETLLIDMINAGMLFNVVKVDQSTQLTITPTPVPLPTGKVSVDIPLTNISAIQESNGGVQVGDYVDAIASFKVEDINSTAPANIQQLVTTQALPSGSQIMQRVIRTALVINLSQKENRLTLAVSPTEAVFIQWILNAHLSLKLRPIPTTDLPNTLVPPPNYAVSLKLDSVSHWATDDLQVGDTVDVVVGLVLGTGQTLKLEFKPYGEYGWVDPLSHGTQSAQMYIPSIPYSASGAIFVRRIIQNAVVTGVSYGVDGAGKQSGAIAITLEIQSDTASTQAGQLKDYVDAGMSYLVVKH